MNKFQQHLAKTNALLKKNPMVGFLFVIQMVLQLQVSSQFLQFNSSLAAGIMCFALAVAHLIPAYYVYVIGDGTGLARAPGLTSKLEFMFLGIILALILSLTFTFCVLGIGCQPFLSLVVAPTVATAGTAGCFAAGLGSLLDVTSVFIIFALGGLTD